MPKILKMICHLLHIAAKTAKTGFSGFFRFYRFFRQKVESEGGQRRRCSCAVTAIVDLEPQNLFSLCLSKKKIGILNAYCDPASKLVMSTTLILTSQMYCFLILAMQFRIPCNLGLVALVLQHIFAPKTCFFETLECVQDTKVDKIYLRIAGKVGKNVKDSRNAKFLYKQPVFLVGYPPSKF